MYVYGLAEQQRRDFVNNLQPQEKKNEIKQTEKQNLKENLFILQAC